MKEPIGLAMVGAGALAARVLRHLALPDVADAVRVVRVLDTVPGRAEAVIERIGLDAVGGTTFSDLLSDPAVDIVSIASPIGLHFEQGMAAIQAGKHVHFNKTMAITTDEATRLIESAADAGVHLVASPGEVLRPHVQRIRELVASGAIGRVVWAACGCSLNTYHEDEPERLADAGTGAVDPSWYFRVPGGGPLYDMTVYALHSLTAILGSVQRVTALSGIRIPQRQFHGHAIETEAHDNTLMLLDFGDGLYAFAYGTAAGHLTGRHTWDPGARIYGTAGEIVGLTVNGEPFDYPGRDLAESSGDPLGAGNQWLLPHVTASHRNLIEQHVFEDVMQLVDWVRLGTPSAVSAVHARHVIEIIEAAYAAAETGQVQTLRTTVDGIRDLPREAA